MRQYLTEHPDQLDSVAIASGEFFRNDSVKVYHGTKHSVSYATNVPEGPSSRYRIYVRLATDSVSADSVFFEIARKVSALKYNLKNVLVDEKMLIDDMERIRSDR